MRVRNRYEIVGQLGRGGMGTVFEARDHLLGGVSIALKCLWPRSEIHAGTSRLLETLRSEFRILATLRHPLLCRVYDFGGLPPGLDLEGAPPDTPGYFLSRELVAGSDLRSAAARPLPAIAMLFAKAAAGLDVLHRAGLRHGDFKPANAIVSGDDVRLIDFGLTSAEHSGERGGTIAYAAPEVLRGLAIDRRADLYALGVALYEVICGELPSGTRSGSALLAWHSTGLRPSLADKRPDAPTALVELVDKLISPDPSQRLPTAAETEAALMRISGDSAQAVAADRPLVIEPLDRGIAAEAEVAVLRRCGRRGGPAKIEIVGAPGSGRTATLTEVGWRAELAGVEVVIGDATRHSGPLAAARPALDQLAAIIGTPLPSGETEIVAALSKIDVGVAIFLDDADFADAGSQALLERIAGAIPATTPLAIVTVRDESEAPSASSVRFECPAVSVAEIETLTTRALGRNDEALAARIEEHTGGNLLHVVATLEHIARHGESIATLTELPPPQRLARSAQAQLAALDDQSLAPVRALAIAGPSTAESLATLTDLEGDLLATAFERARGLVSRGRDGRYFFNRRSTAAVVLDELGDDERAALHARALALYPDEQSVDRMRHLIGALETDAVSRSISPCLDTLCDAGDRAGALEIGLAALNLLEPARNVDELRTQLGEIARLAGHIETASELLRPVVEHAGDQALVAEAALALARTLDAGGDPDQADALFTRARTGPGDIAAQATRDHAHSLLRRGASKEALALVESADPSDPHLAVAATYARGLLGLDADAVDTLDAMAAAAADASDSALEAAALHLAGLTAYRTGDWRRTRGYQERAIGPAEAVGDAIRVGILRMNLAAMDQSEGAWASALEGGRQAVSLLQSNGARTYALMARRNHAQLLLELGATEQARTELEAARADAKALELPIHEIGIDALMGIAAARSGDVEGGRNALTVAEERFRRLGDERRAAETLLDLAELELDLARDARRAGAVLDRVAADDAAHEHPGRLCRLIANRALASAMRGDLAEVRARLDELEIAEAELAAQRGDPLRAELHRRAAQAAELVGADELAHHHRELALTIFARIAQPLLPEQRLAFWQDSRRRDLRSDLRSSRSTRSPTPENLGIEGERVLQLLAIYSQLSAEENPDKLLSAAMEQAALLVGASRGFLLLSRGGDLVMVANRNLPSSQLESIRIHESRPATLLPGELPYSRTIAEEVFRTGEPVISDVHSDSRFAQAASVHAITAPSVLCVPACAGGEVVGALYLESNTSGLTLGPGDARLLAAFGDQVAVLLREAELKRQLVSRAEELERARSEVEALLAERTQLLADRTEELSQARRENSKLSRRLMADGGAFGLIGSSPAMERVYELIERVATAEVPVLIFGESGTGKELVARAIHARSPRADKPLVAVNCGALPQTLLESELFGHVRGAFTGAARDRRGLFETADGSTLFLDEISETPPRMQAALLRAIQEGVVRPVGGVEVSVDVRVVCASNKDLHELAERGEFREDLLYRLEVLTIEIPPLRERRSDIPLLCEHFLKSLRERTHRPDLAISSDALRLLFDRDWPGNVRQLEHALTSAAVMAASNMLEPSDFDKLLAPVIPAAEVHAQTERADILAALERAGWNRSKAARSLGIPRRTFYRRLAKYGIQ